MEKLGLALCCIVWCLVINSTSAYTCPTLCKCEQLEHQEGLSVNCSNRRFQHIPDDIDPETIYLDLSGNAIERIPSRAFRNLYKLAELRLDHNSISEIEVYAFQGATSLERVSLRRNALNVLRENSFAEMTGSAGVCGTGLRECYLDLHHNPLTTVESYAFAWMHYLDVKLGHGSDELTVHSYAFYGSSDFNKIEIGNVPALHLYPRAFTNTEQVDLLRFHDTTIPALRSYHFQGLTGLNRIEFDTVNILSMESSAFSAVEYSIGGYRPIPDDLKPRNRDQDQGTADDAGLNDLTQFLQCGGFIGFTNCAISRLPRDAFTDTNLARVSVSGSVVATLEAHAFRGMSCLRRLSLRVNNITRMEPYALGNLRNVYQVLLLHNELTEIPEYCFSESRTIHTLTILLPARAHLTLRAYALSGLHDVTELKLGGEFESRVTFQPNSIANLVNVNKFKVGNLIIRDLAADTLFGANKIQLLSFAKCVVSKISPAAFGASSLSVGIQRVHIGAIDCSTCSNIETQQQYQRRFQYFSATCLNSRNIVAQEQYCNAIKSAANAVVPRNNLVIYIAYVYFFSTLYLC